MPTVTLVQDEYDQDMVRIYTVVHKTPIIGQKYKKTILSGAMHVHDIETIFGENVINEIHRQQQKEDDIEVDIEVNAEIK